MKNICFMNTIMGWGGGENCHYKTATNLSNRGHDVYFVVNSNSALANRLKEHPQITTIQLEFKKISYLSPIILYQLYKALLPYNIDTILFNSIRDVNTASFIAKLLGINRKIFRYGSYKKLKKKLQTYLSFKYNLTDTFANSKALQSQLFEVAFIAKDKTDYLYNYISTNRPKPDNPIFPLKLGVSARLTFEKGFTPLLKAIFQLKDIPFIAGDGPDKKKIKDLIVTHKLQDRVILECFVEDMDTFYQKVDILMHLSYADGTSNSILEAMSHSLPIIAFNQSSYPEMIEDNFNGFLIEADNIQQIAHSIKKFLNNPKLVCIMGDNSLQKAKDEFEQEHILDIFIGRYLS